jgi:hypothetical protein
MRGVVVCGERPICFPPSGRPIPSIPGARFLQGIYQLNLYVLNEPNM